MTSLKITSALAILFAFSCGTENQTETAVTKVKPTFEIAPPVEEYQPEAEVYTIDNTKDTIIISDHGSFVNIPANAFVDKSGKSVESVELNFTEYTNPADILFSGIPMEYITEEGTETFQSAGMCEISAKANGEELKIAEGKTIDIGLKNKAQDSDYNLYYFDKTKGEWIEKEKEIAVETTPLPVQPIDPSKVDSARIIEVKVETVELRRQDAWSGSSFYLLPGEEPQYQNRPVGWFEANIYKTAQKGAFRLQLNGVLDGKEVKEILLVQPMVAPEDYETAVAEFQQNMRLHAVTVMYKRNKEMADAFMEEEKERAKQDSLIAEQVALIKELVRQDSIANYARNKASEIQTEVIRTFSINQVGIYNCDRFYRRQVIATRTFKFTHNNNPLEVNNSTLCSPSDNAILRSGAFVQSTYNSCTIQLTAVDYYFVGIKGDKIYCRKVNANTPEGKLELEEISKSEFEQIMI